MLTALAVLGLFWLLSGLLALTACMMSSRVSRELDEGRAASDEPLEVASPNAARATPAIALRKAG